MSQLTLPTLVLFFFALPGFIARLAYYSDKFSRSILSKSILEDLAGSLLFAFPLHLVGLFVSALLHRAWPSQYPNVNPSIVVHWLAGKFESDGPYSLNSVVENAWDNWVFVLSYAAFIHMVAIASGYGMRVLVWESRLDLRWPAAFRFRNYWLYRLTGRDMVRKQDGNILTLVHALTKRDKAQLLYSGVLLTFIVDESGELVDLLLINAKVAQGEPQIKNGVVEYDWIKIPGNVFVVKYSEVINLNLGFINPESSLKEQEKEKEKIPAS